MKALLSAIKAQCMVNHQSLIVQPPLAAAAAAVAIVFTQGRPTSRAWHTSSLHI
jgi:hypothetical protein